MPQYLNVENEVINSTFELALFFKLKVMKEVSVPKFVYKKLNM